MADGTILDGLLPAQIAQKAEDVGEAKGNLPVMQLMFLGVLAGAFIALAAVLYTVAVTGNGVGGAVQLPYGIMKLTGGFAFCLGLVLVVVGGAELFTGNNLMVMATISGKLPAGKLLRNWALVYLGNFIGSVATAILMLATRQWTFDDGQVGLTAMAIADAKCGLAFVPAFTLGIYCNALVCLAVWLSYSCRTTTDKVVAILFPITAFVACGFEHCVANMYFVPMGLLVKGQAAFWAAQGVDVASFGQLTWGHFFINNLIPVTLGNIVGGSVFVGVVYWMVYMRGPVVSVAALEQTGDPAPR
jgi:formate/nitrite transporter